MPPDWFWAAHARIRAPVQSSRTIRYIASPGNDRAEAGRRRADPSFPLEPLWLPPGRPERETTGKQRRARCRSPSTFFASELLWSREAGENDRPKRAIALSADAGDMAQDALQKTGLG
jgi:hypothetical protein